jgi:hypothetical protein
MNKGVVIEKGNHESLLACKGHYANLVDKQKIAVTENSGVRAAAQIEAVSQTEDSQSSGNQIQLDSLDDLVIAANTKSQKEKEMRAASLKGNQNQRNAVARVLNLIRPHIWRFFTAIVAAFMNGLVFPLFGRHFYLWSYHCTIFGVLANIVFNSRCYHGVDDCGNTECQKVRYLSW